MTYNFTSYDDSFSYAGTMPALDETLDHEELATLAVDTLKAQLDINAPIVVSAARVYNRKGWASKDYLLEERNPAYSSGSDDVVIQVTVLLSRDEANPLITRANDIKEERVAAAKAARRAELEAAQTRIAAELADLA